MEATQYINYDISYNVLLCYKQVVNTFWSMISKQLNTLIMTLAIICYKQVMNMLYFSYDEIKIVYSYEI